MKICPKCNKTYDDVTLNFCLDDGTVLKDSGPATSPGEPPPTVMMPSGSPFTDEQIQTPPTQQSFETAQRLDAPKAGGRSWSWLWVIVILFAVMVLCGGGIIGLVAIGSLDTTDDPPVTKESPEKTGEEDPGTGDPNRSLVRTDDLSTWSDELSSFSDLTTSYRNRELRVNTRKGYFYVISTGPLFKTYDSSVKITIRNPSADPTSYGYGLVVHSDPDQVLRRDYAFVIRADEGDYRVIRHTNKTERTIVDWTKSKAINSGSSKNDLEVRVERNKMHFYINGDFIRTVTDSTNFKDGVAGIYTSDDVPIAFSSLELRQ